MATNSNSTRDQGHSFGEKLNADEIILGGGIAGITTAKMLHDGVVTDMVVVEATDRLAEKESAVKISVDIRSN